MSTVYSQSLSTVLTVISANIEGFTASKAIHAIRFAQEKTLSLCVSPRDSMSTTSSKAEDTWIPGVVVHSVYNPPNEKCILPPL